ncbi:hypothetical protein TNCV_2274691 [Trichonephila clavipes]|nr:hypothetical protein TNCV_2274691 [Trichonephila clavipes]
MRENVSNQENSWQNGRRTPWKHDRLHRLERRREGKTQEKQSGRLKAVNQGSDQARQEPSIKRCRCRAAKEVFDNRV